MCCSAQDAPLGDSDQTANPDLVDQVPELDNGADEEGSDSVDLPTDQPIECDDGHGLVCTPTDCIWPPNEHCTNDHTLRIYQAGGQCNRCDVCEFPFQDLICEHGCDVVSDACLECSTIEDCNVGVCVDGRCGGCTQDLDCDAGQWCSESGCLACNLDEHCGLACVDCTGGDKQVCARDAHGCVDDNQCPAGFAGVDCEICVRYVNRLGSEAGDGLRWDSAFTDLQTAIDAASKAITDEPSRSTCEVWVARGTYQVWGSDPDNTDHRLDTLWLRPGVAIYGGFSGFGSELAREARNWRFFPTILSGHQPGDPTNGVFHVVLGQDIEPDSGTVLDGFTITGGNADGLLPTDLPEGMIPQHIGGGMLNLNSAPLIRNCVFHGNSALGGGGMANHSGSSPTIANVIFTGNRAISWEGGAIQNWGEGSDVTIENAVFLGNLAGPTGGGAGIASVDLATVTVTNATFSRNQNTKLIGADVGQALHSDLGAETVLTNCIFWDNTGGEGPDIYDSPAYDGRPAARTTVTYSLVEDDCVGEGNLFDVDPLFVRPVDVHLQAGSPAIDAGSKTAAPLSDLDGNVRPTGDGVDMGAYEYQP